MSKQYKSFTYDYDGSDLQVTAEDWDNVTFKWSIPAAPEPCRQRFGYYQKV